MSTYFFFFNLFLTNRGYSEAQLGLLTGAMAAGNLTAALPSGRLIRTVGLRKALIICVAAAPSVLCVRSISPAFPLQLGLAFAAGMTLSLWAVCISPIIASITSERERPLAFSLVFSLGIGVGALGALAGSRMPGWFSRMPGLTGWLAPDQLTLIASCCLAVLALIPALALRKIHSAPPLAPRLFSSPALRRFLAAAAVWGLVTGSFSPFANVFLAVHLHLPLRNIGTVFSVSQLFQVAAVLCAPIVLRRLGILNGVFATQIATAGCFIILALTGRPLAASIIYVALTGVQNMSEPGLYSRMMAIVPEEMRPGASASMALVVGASQLIAAASAGWAFTNIGYPGALAIIAAIAVTAGFLFKASVNPESRPIVPYATEGDAQ